MRVSMIYYYKLYNIHFLKMFINNPTLLQVILASPALLMEFMTGLVYGWVAPAITFLQASDSEIPITIEDASWIASLCEVGRFVGCIPAGIVADKIGRKISLIICAGFYMSAWIAVTFSKSLMVIYISRFTLGIGFGIADVVDCIYLSEISSPALRGIVLSSCLALFFFGILFQFVIALFLSYRIVNMVVMIISIVLFISTFFLIETPQHLIAISNFDKAIRYLEWIRGKENAQIEFNEVQKDMQMQKEAKSRSISYIWKSPINRITMIIVVGLSSLTIFTGFQALISYVSVLFSKDESSRYSVLYGIIIFISSCITPFFIDLIGRRILLLVSLFVSALIHALVAILYISKMDAPSYVLFTLFASYAAVFSIGSYSTTVTVRGELFPQSIKGVGVSISIAAACIAGFLITKLFYNISFAFGIHWNFIIFSLFCILSFIFVYFLLPETKGMSLAQIQQLLSEKNA